MWKDISKGQNEQMNNHKPQKPPKNLYYHIACHILNIIHASCVFSAEEIECSSSDSHIGTLKFKMLCLFSRVSYTVPLAKSLENSQPSAS